MRLTYLILFLTMVNYGYSQESIIKDLADPHAKRKFCFYPSTLRMINVNNDTLFDSTIKEVNKILLFVLDSVAVSEKVHKQIVNEYTGTSDWEEFTSIRMGKTALDVLTKSENPPAYVGIISSDSSVFAFYLDGELKWKNLPNIQQTFSDNPILSTLQLFDDNQKSRPRNKKSD